MKKTALSKTLVALGHALLDKLVSLFGYCHRVPIVGIGVRVLPRWISRAGRSSTCDSLATLHVGVMPCLHAAC